MEKDFTKSKTPTHDMKSNKTKKYFKTVSRKKYIKQMEKECDLC